MHLVGFVIIIYCTVLWMSKYFCLFVCFWRYSPQWVRASSFTRFLDHTQRHTTVGRTLLDEWSARRRDLYLTTHNTHNRQTSIGLLWTRDRPVAETSTWQHTTLSKTFIHRTPLDEGSAGRRDLYLTTHNTHNRQTSIGLLWTRDQPVAETSTWQHTTLTKDRHPQDSSAPVISSSHRPLPDNTQESQQTDINRTPLDEGSARRRDLYLTTHNTHDADRHP